MPDWFYRTVARPVLFCLPDRVARRLALTVIGTLGKSDAGCTIIDFLGHMGSDPQLALSVGGTSFPSSIGLGWRVDPERRATRGLSHFGVGCIEIWEGAIRDVARSPQQSLQDGPVTPISPPSPPATPTTPILRRRLSPEGREELVLPSGVVLDVQAWDQLYEPRDHAPRRGVLLQVGTSIGLGQWEVPSQRPAALVEKVMACRARLSAAQPLVVAGGVSGPEDAAALIVAGANVVLIDAGLVFSGPGLVKRCNDALLLRFKPASRLEKSTTFRQSYFWGTALGLALAAGGLATLALALTRVLLPYDEQYLGLTSEQLRRNLPRFFAFMAHDRGTLAGAMLGLGWWYVVLAWHGLRRNVHGTQNALIFSSLSGFASFFAFFGFGYFDTLHAFVAAILVQFTIQVMVGTPGPIEEPSPLIERESPSWRRAQWAQLFWIIHAAGLIFAGGMILWIGMTSVMVREDLSFLCASADQVQALGPHLLGVIAHDRATLGGMLLASGVGMLLPLLWCFRRGATWLWFGLAGLGLPAYGAALGVHLWVGYTEPRHLIPAVLGLALWLLGLILSRNYLADRSSHSP